mmetsp:Transcript_52007/g.113041  ORF Transcript_52007/g.113041 Transcript_52007/m.113041 type:complete len:214 (+) Transcript_52007:277-918(+)
MSATTISTPPYATPPDGVSPPPCAHRTTGYAAETAPPGGPVLGRCSPSPPPPPAACPSVSPRPTGSPTTPAAFFPPLWSLPASPMQPADAPFRPWQVRPTSGPPPHLPATPLRCPRAPSPAHSVLHWPQTPTLSPRPRLCPPRHGRPPPLDVVLRPWGCVPAALAQRPSSWPPALCVALPSGAVGTSDVPQASRAPTLPSLSPSRTRAVSSVP